MSSIRKIVIAASVANFKDFTFEIAGSNTPACLLSRTLPSCKSKPYLREKRKILGHVWIF